MEWTFKVERILVLDKPNKSVLAYVDVVVSECLLLRGLMIKTGVNGLFVSVPAYKNKAGKWTDLVEFMDKVVNKQMTNTILRSYEDRLVTA